MDERAGRDRLFNRELSYLAFNRRVLELAADEKVPLLERAKFLAIFSQNLDEFFQVRVAGLKDQVAGGIGAPTPDGLTPSAQLLEIRDEVERSSAVQAIVFEDALRPALADAGVFICDWADLALADRKYLVGEFEDRIFPILTPLAVDPGHPFPYISDLSLNLAVIARDPVTDARRFARVKIPDALPRFVALPDGERLLPLEQLVADRLAELFPGMDVEAHFPFRVTRNADLTLKEEEADDLLAAVEMEVRRRRFGRAVRLELDRTITPEVRRLLMRELDVEEDDVYELPGLLDLTGLWSVHELDRPDLKHRAWSTVTPPRLVGEDGPPDMFAELRRADVLVHHPYESFSRSVEEFIRQASEDPKVLAIKLTLYRTSGDSPIIDLLVGAAERRKQVAALVELKARFDEQANIAWARRLEQAGVHVVYGLVGLKTHCKTALVVRDDGDAIRRYCHVGTGNYHPRTARLYEDLGLLSADPELGADLTSLFNYLTGYARDVDYDRLLVAPQDLRRRIIELIRGEMGVPGGRILMKMNSLVDPAVIGALYEASRSGVEIDLLVRGICCLRPGVEGLSERIRVRSIVGRYLEHSRIYYFANGEGPGRPSYYMGSADLMPRNLDRRVEALAPVTAPTLRQRVDEILDVGFSEEALAWTLDAEGLWTRRPTSPGTGIDTHERLQDLAIARGRRR